MCFGGIEISARSQENVERCSGRRQRQRCASLAASRRALGGCRKLTRSKTRDVAGGRSPEDADGGRRAVACGEENITWMTWVAKKHVNILSLCWKKKPKKKKKKNTMQPLDEYSR